MRFEIVLWKYNYSIVFATFCVLHYVASYCEPGKEDRVDGLTLTMASDRSSLSDWSDLCSSFFWRRSKAESVPSPLHDTSYTYTSEDFCGDESMTGQLTTCILPWQVQYTPPSAETEGGFNF